MAIVDERNEKVIRRVKRLLALSENNPNEEEAQSAFVMAQRIMLENDLSISEIDIDADNQRQVESGQVTIHKKLYWWERKLANIMAGNFRVKNFINWKRQQTSNRKSAICFMGYESDVNLAKEMYLLAYEAILHYSNKYVEDYYMDHSINRKRRITIAVKNSYMRGFLEGLESKFDDQIEELRSEGNTLMVLIPKEVEEKFAEEITGKAVPFRVPSVEENHAYHQGYEDGNLIDYTKSTIDEK
ncbi:DUF2786 domain-containing protein [Oceanobacillus alkalisoli]|uniref:DUF2786 domain-containing protein n=1 Tax=Oceanobacillus alkalisoli TaxID=2925113 RepID=UPI001F11ADAF|nr:DUF2786 domain-containing protein [Oceanobacillus alkalisoli]MCF3941588.1 DUF2786 domain-containing protein [Oceanobacillus alkalisoli]